MATTTRNLVLGGAALFATALLISKSSTNFEDKTFVVSYVYGRVRGFCLGYKTLTWAEEERGHNQYVESEQHAEAFAEPELDEMLEEYIVRGEAKSRPRRVMRMPYAYYLVRHCRGDLGQIEYTQAGVKWVERTARAEALSHGVRPSDIGRILPHVVAMYFGTRDGSQSQASRDQQSSAYVNSINATSIRRGVAGAAQGMSS